MKTKFEAKTVVRNTGGVGEAGDGQGETYNSRSGKRSRSHLEGQKAKASEQMETQRQPVEASFHV